MRRLVSAFAVVCACTLALLTAPAAVAAPSAAGPADYDRDTVIVKYRPGASPAERRPLLERAGVGATVEEIEALDTKVVEVEADPVAVAERLDGSSEVAYAEPNFFLEAQAPNDATFPSLWALHNVGQTGGLPGADVGALRGWARSGVSDYPGTGGVPIGMIDTGVDRSHPDLLGQVAACTERMVPALATGSCVDQTGHGTHVAGTLAATADNALGVAGVAFNSPLYVCRSLGGQDEVGRTSDVVECIDWARRQGAEVISMSFAGSGSRTLRRAVDRAWRDGGAAGAVLASAAGNDARRMAVYPAAYPQVVSVGATDHRDRLTWFSNWHRTVELTAPGADILSTEPGGGYDRLSGTSMAVPHVTGVAAQLRSAHPEWTARRVRAALGRSADDLGPGGRDTGFGRGRLDFAGAARR